MLFEDFVDLSAVVASVDRGDFQHIFWSPELQPPTARSRCAETISRYFRKMVYPGQKNRIFVDIFREKNAKKEKKIAIDFSPR